MYQGLVIDGQQHERFNDLRFNCRSANGQNGFAGEYRSSLWNGIQVTGKMEFFQVLQKSFTEAAFSTQIRQVFRRKMQVLNIVNDLFQTGGNCKSTAVRYGSEKYIKINFFLIITGFKISVCHGEFVKVT